MAYLHPGAQSVSEFARQVALGTIVLPNRMPTPGNIVPGQYLHGTCVEASVASIEIAIMRLYMLSAQYVGDYLQAMVNQWRVHNPGVASDGSSSWADATWWMQTHDGLTVDGNIAQDATTAYKEMVSQIPKGFVYLVGTCNAQALPGDESGVHCHGFAALGVDDSGRIVCSDPDNAATQINMPGDPFGGLVAYDLGNLIAAGVTSLTRVHPVGTPYDGYFNQVSGSDWICIKNGVHLSDALLTYWQSIGGLPGLPVQGVSYSLRNISPDSAWQRFERSIEVFEGDPSNRKIDNPPTPGQVYLAHIDDPRFGVAQPPINTGAVKSALASASSSIATAVKELG